MIADSAAAVALFTIVGMEGAINFSVPLYIQIVQGRPAFQTSIAMMPFMLTVFFTAILIVRLYKRFAPRQIATVAFLLVGCQRQGGIAEFKPEILPLPQQLATYEAMPIPPDNPMTPEKVALGRQLFFDERFCDL